MRCPYSFMEWNEGDVPVGGVISNNSVEYLSDEMFSGDSIDLAWEDHLAECDADTHDGCGPEETGTVLIGSWKKDAAGLYIPDETGEYAAIVGETYTQVVWSRVSRKSAWCSPCFPSQGDLDTSGPIDTYDLPADLRGDV
jgi:hypothetical protein